MKQKLFLLLLWALCAMGINAEVISGSCGDEIIYSLDTDSHVLTIEGNGEMEGYGTTGAPWYHYRQFVEKVIMSGSIENIPMYAFNKCTNLNSIQIPSSVKTISDLAFLDCSKLEDISIPNTVEYVTATAFEGCTAIQNPLFNDRLFILMPRHYKGEYEIPVGIERICGSAFDGCDYLESVRIPNSVTTIEGGAFEFSGLTSIDIPNSVTWIGGYAFRECRKLTSVKIPNSVTEIDWHTFEGCSNLTYADIPNSITRIGSEAFRECSNLANVNIPNSVTAIENKAFYNCWNLKSINFPNSLESVGQNAFYGCGIKTVYWNLNKRFTYLSSFTSVKELYFGDDVTTVYNAFHNCYLEKVVLGKNVKEIVDHAFNIVGGEFYITGNTPIECSSAAFDGWPEQAVLYVPEGIKSYYITTEPWKRFGTISEYDATGITVTTSLNAIPSSIYDLSGRKLNTLTKGINVVGNKKVLVR